MSSKQNENKKKVRARETENGKGGEREWEREGNYKLISLIFYSYFYFLLTQRRDKTNKLLLPEERRGIETKGAIVKTSVESIGNQKGHLSRVRRLEKNLFLDKFLNKVFY